MSIDKPASHVTSFLKLFCLIRNIEHVSLARPGATNYVIRMQIDRAIQDQADYVVVCPTSSDRFDIPMDTDDWYPNLTLKDVHYRGYFAESCDNVEQKQPTRIVSDVADNIFLDQHQAGIPDTQQQALKQVIAYLHNSTMSRHKEHYIIRDGLFTLQQTGIDFLFIPGAMECFDWSFVQRVWPQDLPNPYGYIQETGVESCTVTHNSQQNHDLFCNIMLDLVDWKGTDPVAIS